MIKTKIELCHIIGIIIALLAIFIQNGTFMVISLIISFTLLIYAKHLRKRNNL